MIGPTGPAHAGSVYEEYRYDALGRRVLVRSRSLAGCGMTPCPQSYIERTVWDGDQVLVEIRAPGGNEISDYSLEEDSPSSTSGQSYAWGRVLYVHGPGIDAPLIVLRSGMSDYQPDVVTIFPHANWRGEYTNGSHPGSQTTNTQCAGYYGCPAISWPGAALTVDGAQAPGTSTPVAWVGSLLGRKTDGSGLQYLRNRYYDPATGKFTQVDPIGLAGGLNLYGFANGDAVNFVDPFGLWAEGQSGAGDPPKKPTVVDKLKRAWKRSNIIRTFIREMGRDLNDPPAPPPPSPPAQESQAPTRGSRPRPPGGFRIPSIIVIPLMIYDIYEMQEQLKREQTPGTPEWCRRVCAD